MKDFKSTCRTVSQNGLLFSLACGYVKVLCVDHLLPHGQSHYITFLRPLSSSVDEAVSHMRSHTFKVLDLDTFNTEAITLKLEACIHTILL